jgi:hypothetical protein
MNFFTKSGTQIATDIIRIVVGARGAYAEFEKDHMVAANLHMPFDQRWRIKHQYSYYLEYRTNQDNVMIYYQRRRVTYADYKIKKFYIAADDLYVDGHQINIDDFPQTVSNHPLNSEGGTS